MQDSTVTASSREFGWDGVVAELGTSRSFDPTDLVCASHFVALNIDSKPLSIEAKGPHGFRRIVMPPGALWIAAAGQPFTHRLRGSRWGAIEISVEKVQRLLGRSIEPRGTYDLIDPVLHALVCGLLNEAASGGATGALLADGLGLAIATRLALHSGVDERVVSPAGGIGKQRLRRVREAIEESLADAITTEQLALVADLSPAHFARAFKRATGETPHGFVMRRRAERARGLIASGASIADAATRCGFADQAHLTRVFKRRFGMTPGAFVRLTRGS